VDEAGRGCLAGPVVAAAVLLPERWSVEGVADSKALSPQRREALAVLIREQALSWAIGRAEVAEIEALNILRATHLAMARALATLEPPADFALVDGLPVPGLPCPHEAFPGADADCVCVAAASILAKTTRDQWMREYDAEFPGYGFAAHKGYATVAHREALHRQGPCALHRRTFAPVAALIKASPVFADSQRLGGLNQRQDCGYGDSRSPLSD